MKKKVKLFRSVFLIALLFCLQFTVVYAATPIYGFPFGKSENHKHKIAGNLNPSGLGNGWRMAYPLWHNVRFNNGQYHVTEQFDLIDNQGENIGKNRGYHLIPKQEANIRWLATQANGNIDYVLFAIMGSDGITNKHPFLKDKYYKIDNFEDWLMFSEPVSLSGGGLESSTKISEDGVTKPVFNSTYKTTPWPSVRSLRTKEGNTESNKISMKDGKIQLDATAYSVYNKLARGYFVKGKYTKQDILNEWKATGYSHRDFLHDKSRAVALSPQVSGKYNQAIPVAALSKILNPAGTENEITFVIADDYFRVETYTFKFTVTDAPTPEPGKPGECNSCRGQNTKDWVHRTPIYEDGVIIGYEYYYDYLKAQINLTSPSKIRAGSAIEFTVNTNYTNDWFGSDAAHGPRRLFAYFPDSSNLEHGNEDMQAIPDDDRTEPGYPYAIELIPDNPRGSWSNTWRLPDIYVEKFSGFKFYNSNDFLRNQYKSQIIGHGVNDELLNGGRKWYTPFTNPDGNYPFKIIAYDAGMNDDYEFGEDDNNSDLYDCDSTCVVIQGHLFASHENNTEGFFVTRLINPNNPFPDSVGWNWQGRESLLTQMAPWYNEQFNQKGFATDKKIEQPTQPVNGWQ